MPSEHCSRSRVQNSEVGRSYPWAFDTLLVGEECLDVALGLDLIVEAVVANHCPLMSE